MLMVLFLHVLFFVFFFKHIFGRGKYNMGAGKQICLAEHYKE